MLGFGEISSSRSNSRLRSIECLRYRHTPCEKRRQRNKQTIDMLLERYTLGYAFMYGFALMSRSYTVLYVGLFGHSCQLIFLVLVENPHIDKIYAGIQSTLTADDVARFFVFCSSFSLFLITIFFKATRLSPSRFDCVSQFQSVSIKRSHVCRDCDSNCGLLLLGTFPHSVVCCDRGVEIGECPS